VERGTLFRVKGWRIEVRGPGFEVNKNLPPFPARFQLSPEFKLLVACSWIAPPALEQTQAKQIASLCEEGIKWDNFISLADRHRLAAMAYTVLRRYAGGLFPADARELLRERDKRDRLEALRLAGELARLVGLFAEGGIEALPFKGPLLSQHLFGDPGLRQARDIDLLVSPEDLDRTDRLLLKDGYIRTNPGFELTEKQKRVLLTVSGANHYEYRHKEGWAHVEVHWRFDLWTPEDVSVLWDHCRRMEWSGVRVNWLEDDMLLLTICDHGAHHRWFRLKWLSDLVMLISRQPDNGWGPLLALAESLDLRRSLAQGALLACWLYGLVPPGPLRMLIEQEKTAPALGREAIFSLLTGEERHYASFVRNRAGERYNIRLRTKRPYRNFLQRIWIAPDDWRYFPFSDRFYWLYYPLRPFIWFRRRYLK
jgi:hypothetical protein